MDSRFEAGRRKGFRAVLAISVLTALASLLILTAFLPQSPAVPEQAAGAQPGPDGKAWRRGWIPTPPGDYQKCEIDTTDRQYQAAVDLSSQLPPVGDQLTQNCCVAWSIGYYYKTWQEKQEHTTWNLTNPFYQYSPTFIYNQREDKTGDNGMSFDDAFGIMYDDGWTDLSQVPYTQTDDQTVPDTLRTRRPCPTASPAAGHTSAHRARSRRSPAITTPNDITRSRPSWTRASPSSSAP